MRPLLFAELPFSTGCRTESLMRFGIDDSTSDMHMRMDNDVSVEVMESPATWLAPLIPRPVRHGAAQST
jgi:hypothetical protein